MSDIYRPSPEVVAIMDRHYPKDLKQGNHTQSQIDLIKLHQPSMDIETFERSEWTLFQLRSRRRAA